MASVMIVGIGVLFAIQVMKPAPDSGVYAQWFFGLSIPRLVGVLTAIGSSYTLFPEVLTQWHMEPSGTIIRLSQALFGVILFTYFALVFSRRPVALVTYLLSIIAFAVLMYCKHPGTLRHHGHIFVMLVVSMWLFNYTKDRPLKRISVNKIADWCTRHVTSVFMALLVISLAGGIIMSVRDIMTPFSRGKDVARFIVSNGLSNMPILADRDAPCSTVSAYLDVPVYYAADGRWGTYMVFDNQRAWRLTSNQLVDRSARLANEKHGDILVVLNYKMSPDVRIALKAQSIRVFNGAMVGDENYWLYRIKYPVHAQREKFADHS